MEQLLRLQNIDGGFGRWTSWGGTMPSETALAVHALVEANRRGWVDDEEALRHAVESLVTLVNGAAFGDYYGTYGLDRTAYGLRVLKEAGQPQGGRAAALYEQRERLSPYGLAQLAIALGEDDSRTDTLVVEAARTVLWTREDEARDPGRIRWTDRSARVFGAVLEAATRFEVGHSRAGRVAGELLAIRGGRTGYPWATSVETARALHALATYATLWSWEEGEAPHVELDGQPVSAVARTRAGAFYRIPVRRMRGMHRLRVRGADDGPVFFSIDGRWAVPLGEDDEIPRGRATAVHRVYETADGRPIEEGSAIPLGEMIRVRLFVYTEGGGPEMVAVSDPIPAGFEAVDEGHRDDAARLARGALRDERRRRRGRRAGAPRDALHPLDLAPRLRRGRGALLLRSPAGRLAGVHLRRARHHGRRVHRAAHAGGGALRARLRRAERRRPPARRRAGARAVRRALRVAVRVILIGAGLAAATIGWLWATTDVERERFARPEDALTVADRHGTPLRHHRPDGHDRRWVELDAISPTLIDAVLAVEDDRFREHGGVDARATGRALLSFALPGRRLSGGSTITQQVVKLVYGRPSGLFSKPREIVRAVPASSIASIVSSEA